MLDCEFLVYKDSVLTLDDVAGGFVLSSRFRAEDGLWHVTISRAEDGSYLAKVFDMFGAFVGTGVVSVPAYAQIYCAQSGEVSHLDRIEVDGLPLGYVASVDLVRGTVYEVMKIATNQGSGVDHLMRAAPSLGPETMVMTEDGEQPVEWLEAGVRVVTLDHGLQPLRAVIRHKVSATGTNRQPLVSFEAGALDGVLPDFPVLATSNNRVLHAHPMAELMFGDVEVLVQAQDWITGDHLCRPVAPCDVTVTQLVFQRRELVNVSGMWIEAQAAHARPPLGFTQFYTYAQDASTRICLTPKEAGMLLAPRKELQIAQGMIA